MKCNIYLVLPIISILLIISIIVIIIYKNRQDNVLEFFDTTQPQITQSQITQPQITQSQQQILQNQTYNNYPTPSGPQQFTITELQNSLELQNDNINKLMAELTSIVPDIIFNDNKSEIENDINQKIISSINDKTNFIYSSYNNNNINNSIQIDKLNNTLTDLENITDNINKSKIYGKKYKNIKSLNNGMEMNIISTPNTNFQDLKTGSNTGAYLVNVNNGCLSVGANDYDVYKCNDKNSKQLFKLEHIMNETAYANNIDSATPFDNIDKSSISYPFALLRSVNNDNCLTNNHGTLTVQPCYSFTAQRWMPL